MSDYTFKRAKIRKPETWALTGETLSREGESILLSDVTEVMFEQSTGGRTWVTVFKLKTAETTHALQCNDTFSGHNRQRFVALSMDTIGKLVAASSTASVRQGKGNAVLSWTISLIGAAMFCAGLFWFASLAGDDVMLALLLGGVFMAIGAFCIWSSKPWKKPPEQDLHALHQQLSNIRMSMAASR